MAREAPTWHADLFLALNESLVSTPGAGEHRETFRGNIVKDFEISEDEKVFTFFMREGLKWSDGVPVTTEDILFTYEDFLLNEKLTPILSRWMRSGNIAGGEPLKLEVIDKYTFRISFTEPYGGFPAWIGIMGWMGYTEFLKPKHYLKNFHPRYTPLEKLELLIEEEELAKGEWWALFNLKDILNWEFTQGRIQA
ncbi:unnamed protein product, partial [marine sediment metagenome]